MRWTTRLASLCDEAMLAHRKWYKRSRPKRQATDASRALSAARRAARLGIAQLAAMMDVHARTIKRWEIGETQPNAEEWARLTTNLGQYLPQAAVDLARAAGVPSPIPASVAPDARAIEDALLRAADRLDVAPARVRAAVRDLVAAVVKAHGSLDDLARAVRERTDGAA